MKFKIKLLIMVMIVMPAPAIVSIDFDDSMEYVRYKKIVESPKNIEQFGASGQSMYEYFKLLYNQNNPSSISVTKNIKIPKIIHQIWIGDGVPKEFGEYVASIKKHHTEWHYKLWTQHDIPSFGFQNIDLIKASRNPGEISDMMRYEILYRYGGVYLDFDCECLQSLNNLHGMYDFYVGIQPLDSELVQLGIGIIGSIPGHPLLKRIIENIGDNWLKKNNEHMATARTGPIYFTKIFYEYAHENAYVNVALPATYFYPLGCQEYELKRNEWLAQGSFAVHHWAKSWLVSDFRRPEFRSIKNY